MPSLLKIKERLRWGSRQGVREVFLLRRPHESPHLEYKGFEYAPKATGGEKDGEKASFVYGLYS